MGCFSGGETPVENLENEECPNKLTNMENIWFFVSKKHQETYRKQKRIRDGLDARDRRYAGTV